MSNAVWSAQQIDQGTRQSSPSSYENAPTHVHATGHVITVDDANSTADHVIRGSLDAPPTLLTQPDVSLKLKVRLIS